MYERLGELDADADKARASAILSGLGFSEEMKEMPTKRLSGGKHNEYYTYIRACLGIIFIC